MTRARTGLVGSLLTIGLLLSGTAAVPAATAGTIVEATPAPGTPHVLDGQVRAVAHVGDRIILGGDFTKVREADENGAGEADGKTLTRVNLVSFDPATGDVDAAFAPNPDGTVHALEPGPDGQSVYVGGEFTSIGGVNHPKLALVGLTDGAVAASFDAAKVAGKVKDLELADGRLWVAGAFTHIAGHAQPALATLNPTSGALDRYMSLKVRGRHRGGFTTVSNIDLRGSGDRLVAVGNFARVGGKPREQLVMLRTPRRRAALTGFRTRFFEYRCRRIYNSYVEDVGFSPNGSFFIVTTTGGRRQDLSPCDATMRFETKAKGRNVRYSWLDKTGGDSNYALFVTDSVVYVGGHARWQNNTHGDNVPGPGAVSRPGIAALDPDNGLPLSWNPTKDRGVGVFRLFVDRLGLWVGSDTEIIAGVRRARIALMPDQGRLLPQYEAPTQLPKIYLGGVPGDTGSELVSRAVKGNGFGPKVDEPAGPVEWGALHGAFLLDSRLYTASPGGAFVRRAFDGTSYGPAVPVDTSDEITPLTAWHRDVTGMTAMFFDRGRLYFTKDGSSRLFYRYFTPESDVVGADRRVASKGVKGVDFSRVAGMTLAGGRLYWTTPAGVLKRVQWRTGTKAGHPVPGTVRTLSGPGKDGVSWKANTIFAPDPS